MSFASPPSDSPSPFVRDPAFPLEDESADDDDLQQVSLIRSDRLKIALISLHGLIRAKNPELGRDADTGGQVRYVLELAKELGAQPNVAEVELLTRQIVDPRVDEDYAQLEEQISDHAKIVRIPFGPERYLRKELLWPHLELFVDQALAHFRRTGLPHIIHGHYADGGYAGAQLARLLHIPFVFTGHSLGRVKRKRLSRGSSDTETLEQKYKFTKRVEAEEIALETAAMVVTSTNQEVQQQYELYDHYVPDRMEVMPPGVDLSRFSPPAEGWTEPAIAADLARFLRDPDKPMILAMSRPDERKNVEMLIQVYGESAELQERANLVLVLGTRDDVRELPKEQRIVLTKVLCQLDRHDLYGKVAYPKMHTADDVPELYRLAASSRGVFVNVALTEPFGLTLLEAGASGLPVVATNDGGPQDILANCQNGLLVDPFDAGAIERAILRVLTEPEHWETWSKNGILRTRQHYSWSTHAERYLRDLADILSKSTIPVLASRPRGRRIPEFDRLLITGIDDTITGDDAALEELLRMLHEHENVGFGVATGRNLKRTMEIVEELHLPQPALLATDAGTQLHYGKNLTADGTWRKQIGYGWKPREIREILDSQPGLFLQDASHQSEFKISYEIDPGKAPSVGEMRKLLRSAGLRAKVVLSRGVFLDIIPVRGGSDLSMRHMLWKWGFAPEQVLVAADAGNAEGMLLGRTLGVVVGNHGEELEALRGSPRIYFAEASHAAGVIEGINYYNFLGNVVIPNERTE